MIFKGRPSLTTARFIPTRPQFKLESFCLFYFTVFFVLGSCLLWFFKTSVYRSKFSLNLPLCLFSYIAFFLVFFVSFPSFISYCSFLPVSVCLCLPSHRRVIRIWKRRTRRQKDALTRHKRLFCNPEPWAPNLVNKKVFRDSA